MKNKTLLFASISSLIIISSVLIASAAEKKDSAANSSTSPAASASPGAKAPRPLPFHGMVSAVDHKANTFTIAGKGQSRVFKISDKTVVTKGANAATIKDIAENQEVKGSYWKNADGSVEAKTVQIGPMSSSVKTDKSKASASPSASPKKP